MAKFKYKNLILFLFAAVLICTVLFAVNTPLKKYENISFAARPSSPALDDYYLNCEGIISDLGIGEWNIYTAYPEAYSVIETSLLGENCLFFGRYADDINNLYSSSASITTPYLTLNPSHSVYNLSFDYFSPRARELANNITIYSSVDGQKYEKQGEVAKVYNSNLGNFLNVSFDLTNNAHYLRFDLKVYNSDNLNDGIYLKNFTLTPKVLLSEPAPDFDVEWGNLNPIPYTGHRQIPSYTVNCSVEGYEYTVQEIVIDSANKLSDSTEIGAYTLVIVIYDSDNVIANANIAETAFTITKGRIERAEVDYFATQNEININHIALYNSAGDIINSKAGAISYTQPAARPYTTRVTVTENAFYAYYDSGSISLAVNSEHILNTGNPNQIQNYDGAPKTITFENFSSLQSEVRYYRYNTRLDSAPVNAGKYTAEIYLGDEIVKTLTLTILPKEITEITLIGTVPNRLYDGTTNVYNIDASLFTFTSGAQNIQDQSLKVENLHFACATGKTYLVFDKATFGGNYILSNTATVNNKAMTATIEKTSVKLTSNTDIDDETILTITDKQYDGLDIATINTSDIASRYGSVKDAPLEFMGVPKNDTLSLESISAIYDSVFASVSVPVSLKITDLTCFDRFNSDIYTPQGIVFGKIVTKKLDINLSSSDIAVVTKKYDATLKADIIINSVVFNTGIVAADAAIMENNANYLLTYTLAEFADANAGTKQVSVRGFSLKSKNPAYNKVIASYEVNDITLSGTIEKTEITVLDKFFHVISGQSLPSVRTNPSDVNLYTSIHYSLEAAQNAENPIGDFNTTSYQGVFYMRVEVNFSESNYKIASDYEIVVIQITGQKKEQTLSFNIDSSYEHNDGEGVYYKMAVGGKFTPNAVSNATIGATSYLTGLTLTYERNTGTFMTYSQGVYTAQRPGRVSITVSQTGTAAYLAAIPVTIYIDIVDSTIVSNNISYSGELYYGDSIPEITGNALFGGEAVNGDYIKGNGSLTAGSANYNYSFVPSENYLGQYNDINVNLTAQKATLSFNVNNIVKDYYSAVNFLDFCQITIKKGINERVLNVTEFSTLSLNFILHSETEIRLWEHKATPYEVGFDNSYNDYLEITGSSNYEIQIENTSFDVTVNKAPLTVEIIDFSKEYGFTGHQIVFDIKGNYNTQDAPVILDAVNVYEQVEITSPVGRYIIILSIEDIDVSLQNKYSITASSGFMDIAKAKVVFTADNATSVYKEDLSELTFSATGFNIENDKEYYSQFVSLNHNATKESNIGNYVITIESPSVSDNYEFTFRNGVYTVSPATITGVTLSNGNFLYDGLSHSIKIAYDEGVWGKLDVVYNNYDIVEVGKYPITAIVSKVNYQNLILNAELTISSLSITASNAQTSAIITMLGDDLTGFDPRATLMLVQNAVPAVVEEYSSLLIKDENIAENLVGIYNYFLTIDGVRQDFSGNAEIKIKLEGINVTSQFRVLAKIDGEFYEMRSAYQNGYIVFESGGITEFAIVKAVSAYSQDKSSLIIGIGVTVGILVIFYLVFLGYKGPSKWARQRSSRRHNRWA